MIGTTQLRCACERRLSTVLADFVLPYLVGVFILLILCAALRARAADIPALETEKIDYLIASIESIGTAQFIRNDTAYDSKSAAGHLRLKLRNAGSHVKSAADFIRYCASVSSMTGRPYWIRFSDGRQVTAEAYLREKLTEYETKKEGGAEPAVGVALP